MPIGKPSLCAGEDPTVLNRLASWPFYRLGS